MAKNLVKIIYNPVIARLVEPEQSVRLMISEILSYKVSGAEHTGKSSGWDGVSSLFKMRKNEFPAGFVRLIKNRLEAAGYRVIAKSKDAPAPLGAESPKVDDFPEDTRYDYQAEVMRRLLSLKGMIAQVATGGGKSRIFKLCAERINRPTIFITTRKSLMYQMAESYEKDLKKPAGILGDGKWSPIQGGANFAIVDTLTSRLELKDVKVEIEKFSDRFIADREKEVKARLKKEGLPFELGALRSIPKPVQDAIDQIRKAVYDAKPVDDDKHREIAKKVAAHNERRLKTIEFLGNIEFVCLEEAHEVSGNGFYDLLSHCKSAFYRLALTATPFMKDDEEANMRLMAVTGPVGIKVSEKLLIERGILATPHFKYAKVKKPDKLFKSTAWSRAYEIGITAHTARNRQIIKEARRAKRHGLPIMILVQHSKHGKTLETLLNTAGVSTKFIYGKHEQKDRKDALQSLGDGRIDALIGSTILDVGVDVPAVGLVVLAGGGKAEVALRQRIGRGLRAKKRGPNICFVLDFADHGNTHMSGHYRERRRIVEDTPGFAENIVEDFDFAGAGFLEASCRP